MTYISTYASHSLHLIPCNVIILVKESKAKRLGFKTYPGYVLIKDNMKYFEVPPYEHWKTEFLSELLSSHLKVPGFTEDEMGEMEASLCKS